MNKTYFLEINDFKKIYTYEEIYNRVSLYRKKKVDKLRFEKDKWLSLGVEYLLMQGLNELKIDYSKIEIRLTEDNKPFLKNCPQKLFFNLSHSGEMAMCIISDSEVGCDIQKVVENKDFLKISENFFHKEEIKMIKSVNDEEAKELFYRLWVLKESYIKATGQGLKIPLNNFQICLDYNKPKVFLNGILEKNFILEEKKLEKSNYKSAVCFKIN